MTFYLIMENMTTTNPLKEEVISLIKELPDDITLDDILYLLYIKQKLLKAKEDIAQGRTYSHKQVKDMAEKFLK